MSFNPDITKQAKEIIFSRKNIKVNHPDLLFNNSVVENTSLHKHLGLILDDKLSFKDHVSSVIDKASKGINILRKLRFYLPRTSLLTIYKSFIRSHLDYADSIYDQPNNVSFSNRLESIQYNAALAITGAIRGSSRDKIYEELGLEPLKSRRWFRRLCLFYKIIKNKSPSYLYNIIPQPRLIVNTRNANQIPQFFCRTDIFANSFFPFSIREWNKLDNEIVNINSFNVFRSSLLRLIRPTPCNIFGTFNPVGIQILTRLRLGLSHLREHKFRHNFLDTLDPICSCNLEIESVTHFFLRCPLYDDERLLLMNELNNIDLDIHLLDAINLSNLLLYGSNRYNFVTNQRILNTSMNYMISSKRFDNPLI